ncbi:MAG: DNA polymerase III subunit alpha [Patescibacteria group bacterium]
MRFAHLHTHTHYSLLDGLSKIDDLIAHTKALGMDSIAITDHGVMYGAIEFYQKAIKAGIKPIIGCEVYITENRFDRRPGADGKNYYHLILLAENNTGYKNLMKLVTAGHLEGFYYKPRIDKHILREHAEGLIGLSGCLGGEISRALTSRQGEKAERLAREFVSIFGKGNFFLEIQRQKGVEEQEVVTKDLIELSRTTGIPLVATQDSHYLRSTDAHAHEILLAVQTGNTLNDPDRFSFHGDDFSVLSPEAMREKFSDVPQALAQTAAIADRCNVEIVLDKIQLPEFPLPAGTDAETYLRELADKGLERRYGESVTEAIRERLAFELDVIGKTGFAAYFLIVQDLVNWAKQSGIIVGPGRGSAAGSLTTYLLNITNVDPIKYNLIFERFLNPERVSQPDIDIDFDDARRDEVFEYVRQKYGKDHFAQIITFGTMAARGSIRDAGRALGSSYELCDRIAKLVPFNPQQGEKEGYLKRCIEEVDELKQLYRTNPDVKAVIDAAIPLEGVARHSSTHACAVVITPKALSEYVPLQRGTKENDIITQYEMHAIESLGLLKMDFLGLANLTIIQNAVEMIKSNHDIQVDIDSLPLDDKKAFKIFQKAQTTGVFQLESSGMKRYLKDLKPTEIEDIIAMVSLYRPGPMELIPEYIARKHGKNKVEYLHATLEPVLKNTYGIMVYQEQLMQAVQVLAGFTLAEADVMRKAVGKKIRKLLEEQEGKFKEGAARVGTPKQVADKFWELLGPFNRYAFNRSHAACYAMLAYQTAYLKGNYPLEFMAAIMNSDSDDIERVAFLIDECRTMDIEVLPPDINESMAKFSVVRGENKIRFGLAAIKNVGVNVIDVMIADRTSSGPFASLEDFIARVHSKDLNKKSLESLIKCGALDVFGERTMLLASVDELLSYSRESQYRRSSGQVSLFALAASNAALPPIRLREIQPARRAEKLMWEKELLGLFISDHPLRDYQKQMGYGQGVLTIKELVGHKKSVAVKVGGLVTRVQKIVTKTGKPMLFSWIEDMDSKIEIVVFPTVLDQHPDVFKENNIVVVSGKLSDRDGIPKLLCDDVKSIAMLA